jgi:uncharacterized protein YqfA (UPF0365 family)
LVLCLVVVIVIALIITISVCTQGKCWWAHGAGVPVVLQQCHALRLLRGTA